MKRTLTLTLSLAAVFAGTLAFAEVKIDESLKQNYVYQGSASVAQPQANVFLGLATLDKQAPETNKAISTSCVAVNKSSVACHH